MTTSDLYKVIKDGTTIGMFHIKKEATKFCLHHFLITGARPYVVDTKGNIVYELQTERSVQ